MDSTEASEAGGATQGFGIAEALEHGSTQQRMLMQ